jgi:hypothetical protein
LRDIVAPTNATSQDDPAVCADADPRGETAGPTDTGDTTAPTDAIAHGEMTGNAVISLFERVNVAQTADGGLQLSIPPEAAAPMMAMFQQMASLLGQVVQQPPR